MKTQSFSRGAALSMCAMAVLAATACGSDSESAEGPDGDTSTEYCTSAMSVGHAIGSAIDMYNASGQANDLKPIGFATSDDLVATFDGKIKALAKTSVANNKAFIQAVDDGDRQAQDKVIEAQKGTFSQMINLCSDAIGEEETTTMKRYRKVMDEGIAKPPNASEPTTEPTKKPAGEVTPAGKELKFGETVTAEVDGQKFTYAVTKVEKAPQSDLDEFEKDLREEVGQLVYVRGTLAAADASASVSGIIPNYELTTSNGSPADQVTVFSSFDKCKDKLNMKTANMDMCAVFGLKDKSADITKVGVKSFKPGYTRDVKYTWTK